MEKLLAISCFTTGRKEAVHSSNRELASTYSVPGTVLASWITSVNKTNIPPLMGRVTLWTIDCQTPLSMGFSKQEYWSRLPCTPPGYLPTQRLNPCLLCLLHWQGFFTTNATWEVVLFTYSEAFKISPFFLQKFDHFTFL